LLKLRQANAKFFSNWIKWSETSLFTDIDKNWTYYTPADNYCLTLMIISLPPLFPRNLNDANVKTHKKKKKLRPSKNLRTYFALPLFYLQSKLFSNMRPVEMFEIIDRRRRNFWLKSRGEEIWNKNYTTKIRLSL